ncbi:glycosyltransferase [Actinomyces ruminicola]|uniref:glycosyltransferase n=1 Tax=Actinomyces ruminicola TaxID=332524 RepID=UPI0011C7C6AF|nr:glycosyltransferase [Actinomyces ruminicola]
MTRIGYVLKVYPRFSETFVVTEMLAREALGDDLTIYALRPTTDSRFHPEIARIRAQVNWVPRPRRAIDMWELLAGSLNEPDMRTQLARILPAVADLPGDEVAQGAALARSARDAGITHLHAHFASLAGRTAWIASQLSGIPYTVTTHAKDIYHESVDQLWLRRICADAERVIAISRYNEHYLHSLLSGTGARIELRYNALELDRFPFRPPAPADGPLHIAAVGRLVAKKGFDDLIDAVGILTKAGIPVVLDIAGEGEEHDNLTGRITAQGLEDRVNLLGPLTQAEVRAMLGRAQVFAAPCKPADDGNIDGLPTVVLESMACGTPVIATEVTGLPEVIRDGDTGILLPHSDPQALARALRELAEGTVDPRPLARNARALIERDFDSRTQAAALSAWESTPELKEAD